MNKFSSADSESPCANPIKGNKPLKWNSWDIEQFEPESKFNQWDIVTPLNLGFELNPWDKRHIYVDAGMNLRYFIPAEDIMIDGYFIRAGASVWFWKNGKIMRATSAQNQLVDGFEALAKFPFKLDPEGKILEFIPAMDIVINSVSCKRGYECVVRKMKRVETSRYR